MSPFTTRYLRERWGPDEVAFVELNPGEIVVISGWMLDPLVCREMTIGAPEVSLSALADLNQLLIHLGFRSYFANDARCVVKSPDAVAQKLGTAGAASAPADAGLGQAARAEHGGPRASAVRVLVGILMEAGGLIAEEDGDDGDTR